MPQERLNHIERLKLRQQRLKEIQERIEDEQNAKQQIRRLSTPSKASSIQAPTWAHIYGLPTKEVCMIASEQICIYDPVVVEVQNVNQVLEDLKADSG